MITALLSVRKVWAVADRLSLDIVEVKSVSRDAGAFSSSAPFGVESRDPVGLSGTREKVS